MKKLWILVVRGKAYGRGTPSRQSSGTGGSSGVWPPSDRAGSEPISWGSRPVPVRRYGGSPIPGDRRGRRGRERRWGRAEPRPDPPREAALLSHGSGLVAAAVRAGSQSRRALPLPGRQAASAARLLLRECPRLGLPKGQARARGCHPKRRADLGFDTQRTELSSGA